MYEQRVQQQLGSVCDEFSEAFFISNLLTLRPNSFGWSLVASSSGNHGLRDLLSLPKWSGALTH